MSPEKALESQKLTKKHKEAIGILSVGTFLEYFDLMLYVHMAVVLNELFFPKTDPFTASLIAAFSFWSTFLLRPFGALIFGYIGDNIGRSTTLVITTGLMSVSCLLMANLPTYAQIGITASWAVTICRMVQGVSSMGELIGAKLYLAELIPLPVRHVAVSAVSSCSAIGTVAALGVAHLVNVIGLNWRAAFGAGALIALVGFFARANLKEAKDFVDAKKMLRKVSQNTGFSTNNIKSASVDKKTAILYFFIDCAWPIWFYLAYVHCSGILRDYFEYSTEMIIKHNFNISLLHLGQSFLLTYIVSKIQPLKILQFKAFLFPAFILLVPAMLNNMSYPWQLFLIQCGVLLLAPTEHPAAAVFFHHFPIFKRFTYTSFIYALSRMLMYGITSFGMTILVNYFGHWGILVVILPVLVGYVAGISHFIDLEKKAKRYESDEGFMGRFLGYSSSSKYSHISAPIHIPMKS